MYSNIHIQGMTADAQSTLLVLDTALYPKEGILWHARFVCGGDTSTSFCI